MVLKNASGFQIGEMSDGPGVVRPDCDDGISRMPLLDTAAVVRHVQAFKDGAIIG